MVKYGQLAHLARRNGKSTLEHILHHARSLQTNRLTTSIGTRDYEYMLLAIELHIQRHKFLLLAPESLRQQRMKRMTQHQTVVQRHDGLSGHVLNGPTCLGTYSIDLSKILACRCYRLGIGAQLLGKFGQKTHNLATLGILQLAELIIKLNNLYGLYIKCFTRSRLVMNKTTELTLITGRYRNNGPTITYRHHGVGIDNTGTFGIVEHLIQALGNLSLMLAYGSTYLQQLGRGAIANLTIVINQLIDTAHHIGEDAYSLAALS